MANPLITTGYDNVVLIDSQVVLEAKPLEQLPWSDLFTGSILLLVVRQVQTEIDKRKNDGRLGKRARTFNRLLDGFIENRVPSAVLARPRVDVATVANRSIDWVALDDLDRDDGDDRIVAQGLNALVDDPTRLVLLSHDMRPRDAAATHGLAAVKLPETWLRDPDPSPDQRRIAELEARNRLLSADQPQLKVQLEAVTPKPWVYREIGEATSQQVEAIINRQLANAPRQSRRSPFDIGLATYDHSHDGRLQVWESVLREDVPLIHLGLTRLHAQHRIQVTVENVGPISAEGLSLEIRSGNVVLHSIPYSVLVTGPSAPHPRMIIGPLTNFNPHSLIKPSREPFSFYWDEQGPGDQLMLSCASFRQGKSEVIEISIELLSRSLPKAQIEVIVTASNMKGDARAQLLIDVARVAVPFNEAFDTSRDTIDLDPPFDLRNEIKSIEEIGDIDFNWYRNGGSKYDDD